MQQFRIADLGISADIPSWAIHKNFNKFIVNGRTEDISVKLTFSQRGRDDIDKSHKLLSCRARSVYSCNGTYYVINNEMDIPSCIEAPSGFTEYTLYLDPKYSDTDAHNVEIVTDRLFDTMRNLLAYSLNSRKGVIIHSVAMKWGDEGILFSAPSGTGKSTHTNLWRQKYNVEIIDGDNTACRLINFQPIVYGLPWCGTSGEFKNRALPLGAIVFLEQDKENSIVKLDAAEASVRLYARCYLYIWEEKMADQVLETISGIVSRTDCYLLKCRPDFEAVELVRECLQKRK